MVEVNGPEPSAMIPGSMVAQTYGCLCIEEQPDNPGEEWVDIDCPIHGILSNESPYPQDTA